MFYDKLLHKAPLQIISLLSLYPNESLFEREICKETRLATGTVNQVLKELLAFGIVRVTRKGKMNFYRIESDLPLIHFHRIWDNLFQLQPLIIPFKKYCTKIILFGSCANGTDTYTSDLDLCLVSEEEPEKLIRIMSRYKKISHPIKPIIYTLSDFAALIDEETTFYKEIQRGITLFEKVIDHGNEL